jgi:hypothetical protein
LVCTLWDKLHKLMGIQGLNACSLEKMSRADEATEFTDFTVDLPFTFFAWLSRNPKKPKNIVC